MESAALSNVVLRAPGMEHRPATAVTPLEPITLQKSLAGQHLPVLDTWRGLAVTFLMIGHFAPCYRLDCGALGVELFFVLSGFLMGTILFVKQTPLGVFYRRRISRIFPAAYAYLLVMLVSYLSVTSGTKPTFSAAAACLLFYVNYFVALNPQGDLGIPAGHFWSLCVEEHSYILLSALALIHRKQRVSAIVLIGAAIAASFTMSVVIGIQNDWDLYKVYWRSDCRAVSILCGALAACLVDLGWGRKSAYLRIPSLMWGIFAAAIGVACRATFLPEFVQHTFGTLGLAVGLLLISQHARGALWSFPPLVWLGTISFSLYLWQQPFFMAVTRGEMAAVPAILGALACGVISYFIIERPTRAWLNRHWA